MYSRRRARTIPRPNTALSSSTPAPPARAGLSLRYGGGGLGALRPGVLAIARLCLLPALASAAPLWSRSERVGVFEGDEDLPKDPDDPDLWIYLSVAIALVLLGGAFAGLTIALMGQDETYLQVIATSGDGSERKHAAKVLNLLKKGKHWVLVTLLLSNVITNETLPIVLDRSLGGGWPAVLSSTVLIVIFGEIVPQSVCVRYGLSIGAFCAPAVLFLMWIMFPVAWPTAKLLDYLLGEDHGTTYKKAGLKTLVSLHKTLGGATERLMEDEVNIISSVLDLKDKPVCDVMTPMQDVFTMSADTVLDERMMDTILSQGYSRIPIYSPDNSRNFIGMLLVKILITYDPEDSLRVRDFALATLPETSPYTSCLDIINFFQEGKSHMVLVSDFPGTDRGALGVVTLEDVIEELIGEEIIDESDVFVDVHKAIRRLAPAEQKRYRLGKAGKLEEVDDEEHEHEHKDDEHAPLLSKTESRKSSVTVNGTQTPGTTFMMRRKSSNASEPTTKPMAMRSNTADLRQHLKHLGPSNVASKPKPTKYTSVKIKPGVSTIPESQAANASAPEPPMRRHSDFEPTTAQTTADEGTGLLKKAVDNASGGAAAVQASYGTNGDSDRPRGRPEGDASMSAAEASQEAARHATPPPTENRGPSENLLKVPEKLVVGSQQDDDQVGEMEGPSRDRSKPRRTARSGSITETTVDVDGVKKTVLDTHSSSDESPSTTDAASKSTSNLLGGASSLLGGDAVEDSRDRETSPEKGGNDAANESAGGQGGEGKKKKKKKGKKKH